MSPQWRRASRAGDTAAKGARKPAKTKTGAVETVKDGNGKPVKTLTGKPVKAPKAGSVRTAKQARARLVKGKPRADGKEVKTPKANLHPMTPPTYGMANAKLRPKRSGR